MWPVAILRKSVVCLLIALAANAARADDGCDAAIAAAQRQNADIPPHLLNAIGIVETGRRDARTGELAPWPWSVNVAGVGHLFETRQQAIDFVRDAWAGGIRSIDVGCMQVNLLYHPDAFGSLEEAFAPDANVRYAVSFLRDLRRRTGDWDIATGLYHSATPGLSEAYDARVRSVLAGDGAERAFMVRVVVPGAAAGSVTFVGTVAKLPHVYQP